MTINRKTFLKQSILGGFGLAVGSNYLPVSGKSEIDSGTGKEYHVSKAGSDNNNGSASSPFKTISTAAKAAQPGDEVIVHEGIYRERIAPPRGGSSDSIRILYRAAEDEEVIIKGSEVITKWKRFKDDVWKVTIPNTFFGDYNPYKDIITGDWLDDHGRDHHTGQVYINGESLDEMATLQRVLNPLEGNQKKNKYRTQYTWYCESDEENTYIYANFHEHNPNDELTEINARKSCFYPETTGINYVTVRGFTMRHAATQWAPPTAEQVGLIGTRWSKGWIIEDNTISDSRCTGITLGKYGDKWDNTSEDTAVGYVETIKRAKKNGWNKRNIGHHIVRRNEISHCEQAGLVGSLGAIFSQIQHNNIHDVWTKRYFSGAEMAGIKIHASIDCLIEGNRLANVGRGMWMDWMAQGTRIKGNLCYNNTTDDIFFEVDHGPYLVDNNIFLSDNAINDASQGGAFAHNLIAGKVSMVPQDRHTPYFAPHSTNEMKLRDIDGGDNRYYNNIFFADPSDRDVLNRYEKERKIGYGTKLYNQAWFSMYVDGNVYYSGAKPFYKEKNYVEQANFDPKVKISEKEDGVYLRITFSGKMKHLAASQVNTNLLGKAIIPDQKYENPDGSPLTIDSDFFHKKRDKTNPSPGPFVNPDVDKSLSLKVW